jgi:hypothetical protein
VSSVPGRATGISPGSLLPQAMVGDTAIGMKKAPHHCPMVKGFVPELLWRRDRG